MRHGQERAYWAEVKKQEWARALKAMKKGRDDQSLKERGDKIMYEKKKSSVDYGAAYQV